MSETAKIRLTNVAPVNAQFLGATGTIVRELPNALMMRIDGHGSALILRGWGTKTNPGNVEYARA